MLRVDVAWVVGVSIDVVEVLGPGAQRLRDNMNVVLTVDVYVEPRRPGESILDAPVLSAALPRNTLKGAERLSFCFH